VIFVIIEGLTMGLTTIWFAGGAVIALIAALLGAGLEIQIGLFFVVSIILLFSTRKLFVKKLHTGQEKTNVDALIGREAVVTSTIKPLEPGIIRLGSQDWTAICKAEDTVIAEGTRVQVIAIEGVKAVVVPLAE
ncbi:MAG: NfeD family protein, partial [Emergencia timonensis]